jgi:hypothetical protein
MVCMGVNPFQYGGHRLMSSSPVMLMQAKCMLVLTLIFDSFLSDSKLLGLNQSFCKSNNLPDFSSVKQYWEIEVLHRGRNAALNIWIQQEEIMQNDFYFFFYLSCRRSDWGWLLPNGIVWTRLNYKSLFSLLFFLFADQLWFREEISKS